MSGKVIGLHTSDNNDREAPPPGQGITMTTDAQIFASSYE